MGDAFAVPDVGTKGGDGEALFCAEGCGGLRLVMGPWAVEALSNGAGRFRFSIAAGGEMAVAINDKKDLADFAVALAAAAVEDGRWQGAAV